MSDPNASVSDHLGAGWDITWQGKKYDVSRVTPEVVAAVEKQVVRATWEGLKELEDVLPPGDYAERKEAVTEALVTRKDWRAGGERFARFLNSARGLAVIVWACVHRNHPEFTIEMAEDMAGDVPDDMRLVLGLVMPDFLSAAGKAARANPAAVAAQVAKFKELWRASATTPTGA